MAKTGRNDPCPCGSGKKYKNCCLTKDEAAERERLAAAVADGLAFANLAGSVVLGMVAVMAGLAVGRLLP